MKKFTLFVGDNNIELSIIAKNFDQTALLINSSNYHLFLNGDYPVSTGYTGLADMPKDLSIFVKLISRADKIIYCSPQTWSDNCKLDTNHVSNSIQGLTEILLYNLHKIKNNVENLILDHYTPDRYMSLLDSRKKQEAQLWIAGCSISHGYGIEPTQRYGHLLGQQLNLPVSYLTATGSSISWAADQILRSDIIEGDILVWGLTNEDRFPWWSEKLQQFIHLTINDSPEKRKKVLLDSNTIDQLLTDKTNFILAIQKIYQVINFCSKINIKLAILGLLSSDNLNLHLHQVKEFFPYGQPNVKYVDLATDYRHPGPLQNQLYADFCQTTLKHLNYI